MLYINNNRINFANVDYRHNILPGCEIQQQNQSACTSTTCKNGRCEPDELTYKCKCSNGFTGVTCNEGNLLEFLNKIKSFICFEF